MGAYVAREMIGKTFGQYRVLEKLGQGGMGVVYLAHDARLERKVALKFLPPDIAEDDLARERFRREALAAAAIDHPFLCHIHEIGEVDGRAFIAMEYVDGRTLKDRLKDGPLPFTDGLRLGEEIVGALAEAHEQGIVHRDLKPSNIMLTSDGHAKVMDFGLAKSTLTGKGGDDAWGDLESLTGTGITTGTLAYMSPEQIEGEHVDARSDLFAFAVVFHELLTGRHPFEKRTPLATITAILTETAPSLRGQVEAATQELDTLLQRMLARNPENRVQTAGEIRDRLRVLQERHFGRRAGTKSQLGALVGVSVVLVVAVALLFQYRLRLNVESARASIPDIESLTLAGEYAAAAALANEAVQYLPEDSTLRALWPVFTDELTIITDPPGASVYLERFGASESEDADRYLIGTTPIVDMELPRAEYIASIEMEGFEPQERPISSRLNRSEGRMGVDPAIRIETMLLPSGSAPPGMVLVPGGAYRPVVWPNLASVALADFYIDRHEVTNQEYQTFIRAGAYSDRSLWVHTFLDGDRELSFDKAMGLLRDQSGLPGPRDWRNQEFPEGEDRHPVTGVSWYEASAYAEHAGKSLPTVYQWEKASRDGRFTRFEGRVMPWGLIPFGVAEAARANFLADGPAPVDVFRFGISPYGAYNMAGNAGEWIRNAQGSGYAAVGGTWADAPYVYSSGEARAGLDASNTIGFRLVSLVEEGADDQGSMPLVREPGAGRITPVDNVTYQGFLSHYRYDKRELDVEIVERLETPDWTRERITFQGVQDRALAYLYLPKRAAPPYQVIHWIISGTAWFGRTAADEVEAVMGAQIKGGRAVFVVVPRGAIERPSEGFRDSTVPGTVVARDTRVLHVTEYRMGLDYLETRPEIDMSRIAQAGFSWGAEGRAIVLPAIEPRIRSIVYIGGGLRPSTQFPEINAWNFVTRIAQPALVLTGRFDEVWPYDPYARDLYDMLLGQKRLEVVESGHLPPVEIRNPIINEWLDETLGPVSR